MTTRNDPCPCGSGQKFKHCCGRLAAPDSVELLRLLGQGAYSKLEQRAATFLQLTPDGHVWQMLAIARQRQGKEALAALAEAARLLPEDAVAQLNLANALARAERLEAAEAHFARAVALSPRLVQAHANWAELDLQRGLRRSARARCERALELDERCTVALNTLAKVLIAEEAPAEALRVARQALGIDAGWPEAHNSAGLALSRLQRHAEALTSLQEALRLDPHFPEAQLNLALALRSVGRLDEARGTFERLLAVRPAWRDAQLGLATTLRLMGRAEACEALCRPLIEAPAEVRALSVLAELRADQGRFEEAQELHRRALALDPEFTDSWAALARLKRMGSADTEWRARVEALLSRAPPPASEIDLRFAMGKYFDDLDQPAAAFAHYRQANELARQLAPRHDRAKLQRIVSGIVQRFDGAVLQKLRAAGSTDRRPVFIVGMLRSGTTLVEQMLCAHPAVHGAGELTYFSEALSESLACPLGPQETLPGDIAELAAGYLRAITLLSNAARVIDKLPTNFFFLGWIHAAFPAARIIHMQRDPRDTCLSIYFQRFEALNTYANDLADLAHYYRQYANLMGHWRRCIAPQALLEVPYEGLVAQPEAWARRMLGFLELPWDGACLEFHRASRSVQTASRWQVRQPVNSRAVERWRRYAAHLGPLLELEPSTAHAPVSPV
jgi:tetratricopeptide (TPR) repeat protein